LFTLAGRTAYGQADEGAITGVVEDTSHAVIPGAEVTLTSMDTGLVLKSKANAVAVYVFTPIKIGNYSISATAPGFKTVTRANLHLDVEQRLNVVLNLSPGAVTETITVTDEIPLLQTQEGSVGQVLDTTTISDTPLNGRNWVYIAQLTAGVAPPFGGTRGSGSGDFVANGQSAEQNNFILDGVDNNTSLVDFLNGSSYVMRPPPDALAEFKLDTSNYSAEFGHSAGAVVNASIKSGSNQLHGSFWEYVRNNDLNGTNWNAAPGQTLPYHENQFGATTGFPILKNKLFYFGDFEANRISIDNVAILSVPTVKMRQGDFSEMLNPSMTGKPYPVYLYQPNTGGNQDSTGQSNVNRLVCNNQPNVLCANQIDAVAQKILNLYPMPAGPNATSQVFNNLYESTSQHNYTAQWDQRLDWNPTSSDQAYARYSYNHVQTLNTLPLGTVLDGSGYGGYKNSSLAENFMLSETHIISPTITNAFRMGYNWGFFSFLQANANTNESANLGLGGVPFGAAYPLNGGLPSGTVYGLSGWGSPGTSVESQNVIQVLDNVTKIYRSHSITAGVSIFDMRYFYRYAGDPRGYYGYTGTYTSSPAASITTGSGVADFLVNQMNYAGIANAPSINDQQWYNSAYIQDDWKVRHNLTLNLGIRYDYYQPYKENSNSQANFVVNGPLGIGTGSAIFKIVERKTIVPLGDKFTNLLAQNNVAIQYVENPRLISAQHLNLSPRVGFAYQYNEKTVLTGGFGAFFGGLQAEGNGNLGANFPYTAGGSLNTPNCSYANCPSLGVTLENGLGSYISQGLQQFVSYPGFHAIDENIKTPYTLNYNLTVQRSLSKDVVGTLSYIGNVSRHLPTYLDPNGYSPVLLAPGQNTQSYHSFPTLGGAGTVNYAGVSTYNSLQAKVERRFANGLSFLGTYTWAHALGDASDAGGLESAIGNRNERIIPIIQEYTNSDYDVRNRVTVNSHYDLPFGLGKAYLNHSALLDTLVGGWSTSLTFAGQTGTPFTVSPANVQTAAGGSARANQVRNPYAGGGSPDPSNPAISCPASVHNKAHWFNPCAFANPLPGNMITTPVTDIATAKLYLGGRSNQLYGPGYNAVNMSAFKDFKTFREQKLEFRVDSFNLLNHPTLGNPDGNIDNTGGQITGTKFFQNDTPDARFFQLSLKYSY